MMQHSTKRGLERGKAEAENQFSKWTKNKKKATIGEKLCDLLIPGTRM